MITSLKTSILLVVFSLSASAAWACDLCNLYLSINPNDFQHSINVNYRYRSQSALLSAGPQFKKLHSGLSYLEEDTKAEELFQTVDVWGNFFPVQKLQLSFVVPVTQHQMIYNEESAYTLSGVGDITLLGLYQLHNTTTDTSNVFRQRISVGGGVKLPTGNYKQTDDNGEIYNPHMQVGTGSTDFIFATEYLGRFKNWGLSTNLSYRISSENPLGYTFANRFNWTTHLFYQQPLFKKKMTLMPKAGFYHEQAEQDSENQELVASSGGTIWFGSFGGALFYKKLSFSGVYQPVLQEQLNGKQFPNNSRFILSLTWYIPSKFAS